MMNDWWANTLGVSDFNAEHNKLDFSSPSAFAKSFVNTGGLQTIPLIGAPISRLAIQGPNAEARTGSALNGILPSVFGTVSRWKNTNFKDPAVMKQEWDARSAQWEKEYYARQQKYLLQRAMWASNKSKRKYSSRRSYSNYGSRANTKMLNKAMGYPGRTKKNYAKRSYTKTFSSGTYFKTYNPSYGKYNKFYNKPMRSLRHYNSLVYNNIATPRPKRLYAKDIYKQFYTKNGKRKMDILGAKATRKNLNAKIKIMYNYYR